MSSEQEVDEGAAAKKTMTPWEQHSAVISIPRFDYTAPSSLLQHSHSGFLITCTIKREKSATKEAISILEKYCRLFNSQELIEPNPSETSDASGMAKKRKISVEESDGVCPDDGERESLANESVDKDGDLRKDTSAPVRADPDVDKISLLSLVKLTRSGLVLFTFPRSHSADTVNIVSDIMESLKSGNLSSPLWCHRIFPIQATCSLDEEALRTVVQNLVRQYINDRKDRAACPVKFAVGYNRRGIEETELKTSKDTTNSLNQFPLLDRNKCFGVVAAAVKEVITDSVVDLKTPEVCVLVELLPLSAVSTRSLVVAVSVLPEELITAKPRLCVKALAPDSKARNGKK